MKTLELNEFMDSLPGVISAVTVDGDVVRVDCGAAGAFVMIDEPEYEVFRDALALLFALVSMDRLSEELRDRFAPV